MDLVEKELRDLFMTTMATANTAAAGTTDTNITIVGHGLSVGDTLFNVTRGNALRAVAAIVDIDNFTVAAVSGQTTGDAISFPKLKRFYVGQIDPTSVQTNLLPLACIYGTRTTLPLMAAQADKYAFEMTIEVYINAFDKVSEADVQDDILQAQKALKLLMEERNPATDKPIASCILGTLRGHIRGTHFLFTELSSIEYSRAKGTTFFMATLHLKATQSYQTRP